MESLEFGDLACQLPESIRSGRDVDGLALLRLTMALRAANALSPGIPSRPMYSAVGSWTRGRQEGFVSHSGQG